MSIQYSDLFNLSNINTDSLTVNNLDVINETVESSLILSFVSPNLPLKTNAGRNVISAKIDLVDDVTNILPISLGGTNSNTALNNNRIMISSGGKISESSALLDGQILIGATGNSPLPGNILGKNNQIYVNNGSNTIQLSLPQDINITSAVTFGDITDNALTASSIVATDVSKKLISRTIQGTANQININTVGTTTTFSTPQDIATTSAVTFGDITDNALTASSIVATDASKKLISRTIQGTANQVNISTVGTTTTFSTPQNIATTSNVTFNSLTTSAIESVGSSLAIGSNNTTQTINIGSGTGLQTVNIGSSGSGVTTINIGASGDVVNVAGSLNYIQTDNLEVKDNLIVINKGSVGSGTARGAGINIRDNSVDNQGYITTGNTGNFFTLKAPENSFVLSTPILTANSTVVSTNEPQTINGNKTFSGTVNLSALTASTYLGLDASKNIISLSDPASNLLSSNNTWSGNNTWNGTSTYWGSTLYYNDVEIIGAGTPNRLVMTNGTKKIVNSSFGESDLVLRSTSQTIGGVKTFTNNPIISPGVGVGGELFIRGNNETGFSIFSTNNTNGLQVWSTVLGTTLLGLRNALTANRILTTDGSNYLASASFGASDIVLTSGNQTIAGNKTFSGQVNTGKYLRAWNIIANPFNIASGVTSAIQFNQVLAVGIGNQSLGNTIWEILTPGQYLVTWTIRITVAAVWEISTWIELASDPSFKFGLTAIPPGSQYISSSTILNAGIDTFRVMVYNGRSDAATVRIANSNDVQLFVKYIGSN